MRMRAREWLTCGVAVVIWACGLTWAAFCMWLLVLAARCGLKYLGS